MKVLITGGLGGVGRHLSRLLLESGFEITIFDFKTKVTAKRATEFSPQQIVWGNIKDIENHRALLTDQDAVIHLAFLTPFYCENNPNAYAINVGGTQKLVNLLAEVNPHCRFIFASTVTVIGPTTHLTPPITIDQPLNPTDTYTKHKVECEQLLEKSPLTNWLILRFSEAPYLELKQMFSRKYLDYMYSIPAETRIEFVHIFDVALAVKNALTIAEKKERFIIAGGKNCQTTFYEQIKRLFAIFYLPPPKKEKFSTKPYYLDWYDTTRAQAVLQYQTRTLENYLQDIKRQLGKKRILLRLVSPISHLLMR